VGVKCKDGVILGVEKLVPAKMLVEGSGRRVAAVDEHVGAATAGLAPDGRTLVARARDEARAAKSSLGEPLPPSMLADRMGAYMHLFTVYWYLRPFGAAVLLAGWDAAKGAGELYCAEPTGLSCRYHGHALGKGARAAKTEIEKGGFADKTVEEALAGVAKILLKVHDDAKDKPMEVELGYVSAGSGGRWTPVGKERRDAAVAAAREALEAEEMDD